MNFTCPECGERVRGVDASEGDSIECPHCEAQLEVPRDTKTVKKVPKPVPIEVQPIVVLPTAEDSELVEEKVKDLQESRQYRKEDRAGNPIGITGFAVGMTTLLFLFSAAVMHKELPVYLWFVAILSVPTSLLGLVFSIIGSLLVGRPKLFSLIGVGIGALLILAALPISFLLLKSNWR